MELPNLEYIDQLAGDDTAFRNKLIYTLKTELPEEVYTYKTNVIAGNLKEAAGNVHKLKHKISILGMEKSYYLAEEFEDNLLKNSELLKPEFEKVLIVMQEFTAGL